MVHTPQSTGSIREDAECHPSRSVAARGDAPCFACACRDGGPKHSQKGAARIVVSEILGHADRLADACGATVGLDDVHHPAGAAAPTPAGVISRMAFKGQRDAQRAHPVQACASIRCVVLTQRCVWNCSKRGSHAGRQRPHPEQSCSLTCAIIRAIFVLCAHELQRRPVICRGLEIRLVSCWVSSCSATSLFLALARAIGLQLPRSHAGVVSWRFSGKHHFWEWIKNNSCQRLFGKGCKPIFYKI